MDGERCFCPKAEVESDIQLFFTLGHESGGISRKLRMRYWEDGLFSGAAFSGLRSPSLV